jgi:hypothetical protein
MLFHWNIRENPSCECGTEKETIQHIVEECPLTKFQQGFSKLHLNTYRRRLVQSIGSFTLQKVQKSLYLAGIFYQAYY